uniref:Uncharacterized protein orf262 n=1 Tax=Trebouxia aggregata TaxID=160068 RepID=G8XPD2_9CHLO|nr:hypothetical protein [Trebouxia aggregata]
MNVNETLPNLTTLAPLESVSAPVLTPDLLLSQISNTAQALNDPAVTTEDLGKGLHALVEQNSSPEIQTAIQALVTGNKKEFGIGQKSSSFYPTLDLFSQSVDPNYPTLYLQKQLSTEISTDLKNLEAPPAEFKISSESVLPRKGNEGSSSVSNKVSIDIVELAKTVTCSPLTLLLVLESGRAAITDSARSKGIFVAEQLSNIMREEFRIGGIPLIIPLQLKPSLEDNNILPLSPTLTVISKITEEMDDRIQAFYNKSGNKNA